MDEADVKKIVKEAFFESFENITDEQFGFDKDADSFPEWDSLSHMTLVASLETKLGISFEIDEISEMDSVGKIVEIIKKKLGVS